MLGIFWLSTPTKCQTGRRMAVFFTGFILLCCGLIFIIVCVKLLPPLPPADYELAQLQEKLRETELVMEKIVSSVHHSPDRWENTACFRFL